MSFKKGRNKTGGRQKGSENKITSDLRGQIKQFVEGNFNEVVSDWKSLPVGKDKLTFYMNLIKFVLPQLSNMQVLTPLEKLTDDQLDEVIKKLKQEGYDPKR